MKNPDEKEEIEGFLNWMKSSQPSQNETVINRVESFLKTTLIELPLWEQFPWNSAAIGGESGLLIGGIVGGLITKSIRASGKTLAERQDKRSCQNDVPNRTETHNQNILNFDVFQSSCHCESFGGRTKQSGWGSRSPLTDASSSR
jgi:hypothetical protein